MESLLFLTNWQCFLSLPLSYFLCLSLRCCFTVCFSPPLSNWFFHTLLYFPGFMPYICNPNIHPIHSPNTVSLFGWYINTHSRALVGPSCVSLASSSSVAPASGEGLLLQDNAVSAEIRALLSSYYSDRWSISDEKLPDPPSAGPCDPNRCCHPCDQQLLLGVFQIWF